MSDYDVKSESDPYASVPYNPNFSPSYGVDPDYRPPWDPAPQYGPLRVPDPSAHMEANGHYTDGPYYCQGSGGGVYETEAEARANVGPGGDCTNGTDQFHVPIQPMVYDDPARPPSVRETTDADREQMDAEEQYERAKEGCEKLWGEMREVCEHSLDGGMNEPPEAPEYIVD